MKTKNDIFDINGIKLDEYQKRIIMDDSQNLLVIAGAGSGKTLTIIAKIKYLVTVKKIKPKDILCISFTNETVNNLIIHNKKMIPVDNFDFFPQNYQHDFIQGNKLYTELST